MKIILINIRYGYVGGPERYLFNVKELLQQNGHEIIPFSIKYPINEQTEYENYFVSPLSDDESVYYKNQGKNIRSIYKTLERNFYSKEVEQHLTQLIDDTKPDFAYVLLYLRKLSPAILVALKKRKVPFIVRLSDFGMICPSHNLFRNSKICELCKDGNLINSVRYKCVHNSYTASMVNYVATKYHWSKDYFGLINHFVSPSMFLINKMIDSGWESSRFSLLPTFAQLSHSSFVERNKHQLIYAGRLEFIKGIDHLLVAIKILLEVYNLEVNLKLAGNGDQDYVNSLKEYILKNDLNHIEFLGNLDKDELMQQFKGSTLSIIPSLVYDNLPNSALESLAVGTPVIAPSHGCFPEIVIENKTGFLYKPGDSVDMAQKIYSYLNNASLHEMMNIESVNFIKRNHSPEIHYNLLISIIEKVKSAAEVEKSKFN